MITPRVTRLVRVPDLRAMHHAIAAAALRPHDPAPASAARACAVVVPTAGAAETLRRTLESTLASGRAMMLPDLLPRAALYERLHERLPDVPRMLSAFEREVMLRRAALDAEAAGAPAPFRLRAGLIAEMLAFYDELRRRDRALDAFERLMVGSLEPSGDIDRGAARLLTLTRFLTAAFRAFEARVAASGALDEHALRARLIAGPHPSPYRRLIVAVPDQAADAAGLWPADYTLIAQMPDIEAIDVVATEHVLGTGYLQRLHQWLPGIEEVQAGTAAPLPVLAVPEAEREERVRWFVCRDREEELAEFAREIKDRHARGPAAALSRTAVVFHRPLPYLYLARQVFEAARVPYQALDALPLAAEPFAAAIDLVFSFAAAEANRDATMALLASPHWTFHADGRRLLRRDVTAADDLLHETKYAGGWDRLTSIAAEAAAHAALPADSARRERGRWARAAPALMAADAAGAALRPMIAPISASMQITALLTFVSAHESLPAAADAWYERHMRARAAVLGALQSLRDAHLAHDDTPLTIADLAATVRRWIEGQTFAPRTGQRGLTLVDAQAAAYADVDDVRLVGLVEPDWPEVGRRNIFYPSSLLTQLGWPADSDRLSAARARFQDLVALPRARVSVSTFTLEDDAIVPPSALLEELDARGLPVESVPRPAPSRVFVHEAIDRAPIDASVVPAEAAGWLALRQSRSPASADRFHGMAGARASTVYAVSRLERYLECPFKYFAAHVLQLREEQRDESALTPQERGLFVHDVFEAFFSEWQGAGRGTINTGNVAEALAMFERVAETRLARLGDADRALERTFLLGSAAAAGLAERAFAFEIEDGGTVVERLLEHSLEGEFTFQTTAGERRVRLRAKADRIDLMDGGTLRVIDYKLGKAPKPSRVLQLSVYGVCAEQQLEGRHGRSWTVARAGYVAFKEKNAFVELGGGSTLQEAVAAGADRLFAAVDAIERGEFPVTPDEPYRCRWCGYAGVCRKDYVGDE